MLETMVMVKKKHSLEPAALQEFPFFSSFSLEQLQGIILLARVVSFKAKRVLYKQDEYAEAMYLILEGGVKIEAEDSLGAVYLLGEMGKGQVVGEPALLRNEPSRVTVTTTKDSELLAIDRLMVLDIIRNAEPVQTLNIFFALNEQTRTATERGFKEVLSKRMLVSQMEVEKQRALTQMVAGVAHEINTPLGVINTAVNIMARELATAPAELTAQRAAEIAESLELMRLNVEHADHLVQNFKNISVSQLTDEKGIFNLVEVIEETIDLIAVSLKRNQIQVKFHNQLAADQKHWVGYRGLVSQILINLLTNIERYAYPNGVGGVADVTISLDEDKNAFSLSVHDYGGGISQENQKRAFEPFFTTGRAIGGTGLGLSIVHNIAVNLMKGTIKLNSSEKGTEFVVTFPRVIL
jgi:signal transduction histidine kinase